jgi:hypothetical protein
MANEIELGQPLKSALVDELGFPVAEGTVFQTGDEVALVLQAGRCFWADDMAPLRPDEPSPPWAGGYGLLVGTLLHVKRPGDLERAWVSRLIGFNDDAVFVAWPGLAGTSAEPCDGDLVLVRGFTGTSIHSFRHVSGRLRARRSLIGCLRTSAMSMPVKCVAASVCRSGWWDECPGWMVPTPLRPC